MSIDALEKIPDISFIDNLTLKEVQEQLLTDYAAEYERITGKPGSLPGADPARLVLNAAALQIYQAFQYVDRAGKMSMLKYSYGNFLDNLAALKGLVRKGAICATTNLRFTLSAPRTAATGIPGGTRVQNGDKVYFMTDTYAEIPAGDTTVDVSASALVAGTEANGCTINTLTKIVDPVPYIRAVTNTTVSGGGDEVETDDDLRYRVYMAPVKYSTAGPKEAYEYWAKQYRSDIDDILVYTPAPTEVVVLMLMDGGLLPSEEVLNGLEDFLRSGDVRPLTDKVTVAAPEETDCNIRLRYYISTKDASQAADIQDSVTRAVAEYKAWQRKIGRDINPSELIRRVVNAGAKRVEVSEPVYKPVDNRHVCRFAGEAVVYGGLEDE